MASPKNIRHGRIKVISGDSPTPLEKVVVFTDAGWQHTENFPTNIQRDRGDPVDINAGDDQPIDWQFSVRFVDKTLYRTLRDKVWDGFAETVTGLTPSPGGPDLNVPLTYAYEQDSLQLATGETGTKLANGAVPAADNEFSEEVGAKDIEKVVKVERGDGTPGSGGFNIQQPSGDTDRDVVYDAVGRGTLGDDDCAGGRKTVKIVVEVFDPCDPPKASDLTLGTVVERIEVDNAFLTQISFAEGDEADIITFIGQALPTDDRVQWVTV